MMNCCSFAFSKFRMSSVCDVTRWKIDSRKIRGQIGVVPLPLFPVLSKTSGLSMTHDVSDNEG